MARDSRLATLIAIFTNAYANKGMSLYKLKRYQEAVAAFEQTIRLNPNSAVVYNGKGWYSLTSDAMKKP